MNCGSAFNLASHLRQSYSVAQYRARAWVVASCTPCVASETVSRSGHLVALMRLRNSASSDSGTFTSNLRIASFFVSTRACAETRLEAAETAGASRPSENCGIVDI
jgi:hypothetical protein